jgi:hypothetical protein
MGGGHHTIETEGCERQSGESRDDSASAQLCGSGLEVPAEAGETWTVGILPYQLHTVVFGLHIVDTGEESWKPSTYDPVKSMAG